MKIAFIGQKGIPATGGGIETHVEELAVRLVKAGHEVFAYTRPNYTDPKLERYKGIELISLSNIATKHLDTITHTFRAILDLRNREVDVVHIHSIGPALLTGLVRLVKPGVPVVATYHSKCYKHQKWGGFAKLSLMLGEYLINRLPDKTIAISKSLAKYAKEKYENEAVYIPNGVNTPKPLKLRDAKKKFGLTENGYILIVSRLVKHKGIGYLIQAYNQLKTNKKLVIAGGASYTDEYVKELKQLAKGNKNIIFTGNQTGRMLNELYTSAYLCVQPSESEGLSISLLEALSFGKAVLVSDISENKEAIGQNGLTFKNKDVNDLARKLNYLLKHKRLINLISLHGAERVKKLYNWEDITKKTIRVYEKAVDEKQTEILEKQFKVLNKVSA